MIAADNDTIFVSFSGTKSKEQLVTELIESIGRPKHKVGSCFKCLSEYSQSKENLFYSCTMLDQFIITSTLL